MIEKILDYMGNEFVDTLLFALWLVSGKCDFETWKQTKGY